MDFVRLIYRWIAILLLLAITGIPGIAANESAFPHTSARAAILMDQYGQVLYAHNADAALPMASTTKIMTALVALELGVPEQRVKIPQDATGIEGSSAYLMAGEEMSLETLLYALLLQSANDAAVAIAICLADSVEGFVDHMNRKAKALGLSCTHFTNPHGLDDPAHYTSASDLARLTTVALRNSLFAKIVSTIRYEAPVEGEASSRLFVNHNRLLREYDGCIGVKTGYTQRTGRCLVTAAERNGLTLIAVTLNDPNDWQDHKRLLDYGFSLSESVVLTPSEGIHVSIPMVGGEQAYLPCESKEEMVLSLPQNSRPTMVIELPHFVFAGVPKGKQIGRAVWYLNGTPIAALPLYAAEEGIAKECPPTLWMRISQFFSKLIKFIIECFKPG